MKIDAIKFIREVNQPPQNTNPRQHLSAAFFIFPPTTVPLIGLPSYSQSGIPFCKTPSEASLVSCSIVGVKRSLT